jgi:nitrous oxide reductase
MKKTESEAVNRRAFLKTSAALGASAAVATLLPGSATADSEEKTTTCDGKKKGYQVSRHVADYYRASRKA